MVYYLFTIPKLHFPDFRTILNNEIVDKINCRHLVATLPIQQITILGQAIPFFLPHLFSRFLLASIRTKCPLFLPRNNTLRSGGKILGQMPNYELIDIFHNFV